MIDRGKAEFEYKARIAHLIELLAALASPIVVAFIFIKPLYGIAGAALVVTALVLANSRIGGKVSAEEDAVVIREYILMFERIAEVIPYDDIMYASAELKTLHVKGHTEFNSYFTLARVSKSKPKTYSAPFCSYRKGYAEPTPEDERAFASHPMQRVSDAINEKKSNNRSWI